MNYFLAISCKILLLGSELSESEETDSTEIRTLIQLLHLGVVSRSSRVSIYEFRNRNGTRVELFRLTMCMYRFKYLLEHVIFDNLESLEAKYRQVNFVQFQSCSYY